MSQTNPDTQCIIVFPVYKSLNAIERSSFEQAVAMTQGYKHVFVAPRSFQFDSSYGDLSRLDIVRFDDTYFQGIEGYNYLMLSAEFYKAFSDYEYILIHQSDVYLFRPDLAYWCSKGYDYIGAPWLKPNKIKKGIFYNQFLYKVIGNTFPKSKKRKLYECYNAVGNGGFSLRKVSTFLDILGMPEAQRIISIYKEKLQRDSLYNEDIFWSVETPHLKKDFSKPHWREALSFAMETYPQFSLGITNGELPFGCHAPLVYEPEFWKKYIPILNI